MMVSASKIPTGCGVSTSIREFFSPPSLEASSFRSFSVEHFANRVYSHFYYLAAGTLDRDVFTLKLEGKGDSYCHYLVSEGNDMGCVLLLERLRDTTDFVYLFSVFPIENSHHVFIFIILTAYASTRRIFHYLSKYISYYILLYIFYHKEATSTFSI